MADELLNVGAMGKVLSSDDTFMGSHWTGT